MRLPVSKKLNLQSIESCVSTRIRREGRTAKRFFNILSEKSMKFGMNLLLWTGEMNDSMLPVVEMLRHVGYDGVELPIFNTALDYASWGKRLDSLGLQRTAVCIRTEEDNP